MKVPMPRHFSLAASSAPLLMIRIFRCSSTARSKSLRHHTAKESLSLHCRDTFALFLRAKISRLTFLYFQHLHSIHSCLAPYVQKLPVPHARVTPLFTKLALLCKQNSTVSFSRYTCFCLRLKIFLI